MQSVRRPLVVIVAAAAIAAAVALGALGARDGGGAAAPMRAAGSGGAAPAAKLEAGARELVLRARDGAQRAAARERRARERLERRAAAARRRVLARLEARIAWRPSTAVGAPDRGRLVLGVRLPAEGRDFFTWDPIHKRSPNRSWRRYGADWNVRATLAVLRRLRAAHPRAPRIAIGDLSRPRGGDFGMRFGPIGHRSHHNGRDIDLYYPRFDRRERAPRSLPQVDRRLSQELVNLFVQAGAVRIFVGPRTGLRGPPGIVQPLRHHDTHLHVRFPALRG